jgi:hypothetical protein
MLSLLNALEINRRHTVTELIHRHALRRSWRRELKQPRATTQTSQESTRFQVTALGKISLNWSLWISACRF